MSSAADDWSFHDLSDDYAPARAAGARVSTYQSRSDPILSLTVWFAGAMPSNEAVDRVLRDCAAFAAARDSSRDVFLHASWLPSADAHYREFKTLFPYGRNHFLCFDARVRQIGVRKSGGKHFVPSWPADDVAALCRRAYAEHAPFPLDDYEDSEDVDSAENGLRADIVRWIWYGYHSHEEINRFALERADDEDGIDVEVMRSFVATVLARKRAAEVGWPDKTDNDRLADAFSDLSDQGILAVQWAGDTLLEGFEVVNEQVAALDPDGDRYTGACFFHSQDMESALYGQGLLLAFGHFHSDEPADYIDVGNRVCEALRQHGLKTEWNGSQRQRIALPTFCWQRRTPG